MTATRNSPFLGCTAGGTSVCESDVVSSRDVQRNCASEVLVSCPQGTNDLAGRLGCEEIIAKCRVMEVHRERLEYL